ncbi:silver efflux pump [Thiohalobacter thiocyanaticus]|uniref:Silver efflux pump n=1 Tax=Thiohalobacter thiocyanaticus TaxID=585455 RepID=A0A1Z4VQ05_9GAMM|nr:efflux RND transporter permease subunit [Thiohalobacter thiocyanaticus]BAZ93716.1 silver efflux pump [Thiohalobacter thiocyanaticus]
MIKQTIDWSLRNRLLIFAAALLLLLWGGYESLRMPVDVFPDLTAPTVTVVTEAHGMAPQEVESLITRPIESAMNGASGVRRVRSSTGIGIAVIWVEFEWGTDIYQARQIVNEKLQLASSSLPQDLPRPVLAPVTSIMGEIMFIALHSDRHDPMQLKTAADWTVRPRLLAVPGVAEVIPNGGQTRQYQVRLDPVRLAAYEVSVDQVLEAAARTNHNVSAGFYVDGGQEVLIHGEGRVQGTEDIAETLVVRRDGQPVLIRDLGEVDIGPAPMRGTAGYNGKEAIVIGIQKQPNANTLELTERLDGVLGDLQASLPEGMRIDTHLFRQADFISVSIHNLMEALRDGAILVIAIVFVFLVSLRATLITLIAIPLSLVTAVLALKAMGSTLNTMTLGGMAIALGALVDDAIIVVENIVRRLRENALLEEERQRSRFQVVLDATREIQSSIVFATLIIMLVFLPLFFLSGVESRLMQPLGFAYVVSLAASLVVAITVTPVLSYWWLSRSRTVRKGHESRLSRGMKSLYEKLLNLSVRRWKTVSVLAVAALIPALYAIMVAGKSFLPEFNEGSLTVSAVTLPGTSLEQSDALGRRVENTLLQHPEVVATARRTGRAELDPHAQGIHASEMEVTLEMGERSKAELLAALRSDLGSIPGMNIIIGQPISHRIDHMLSGTRANIAVKLFGQDLYELRTLAQQIKGEAETVPGAVDVSVEQQADIPFLKIHFDRSAIARHGLHIEDVAEAIRTAYFGTTVSRVLEGRASFDLVVRFRDEARADMDAIRETLITTPEGAQLPLQALADIRYDLGPNTISRENVQRKIVIMANVAGRDLNSVVEDIRQGVEANVELPRGYHVEYGGQFESAESATRTLLVLGTAVIIGMYLLLFVAFHSARDAALIMVNLPLALIGGVVGVYAMDGILSVASIIGFITLFGIATRNGVMMVAHIQNLIASGEVTDVFTAVKRGAMERLIPILMTALATGLALVPLALSAGEPGSEIQAPMAVVILFGLLSSTFLNMIVVPALYLRFGSVVKGFQSGNT